MKNLVLLLICIPLLLIAALRFSEGDSRHEHYAQNRAFTCSSCHATIIDGIIIGGKGNDETDGDIEDNQESVEITIALDVPQEVFYESVTLDIKGDGKNEFLDRVKPYLTDDVGQIVAFDLSKNELSAEKKEHIIKLQHYLTLEERQTGEIKIEGVLSNLDGTLEGDYSFSKTLSIFDRKKDDMKPIVYPTIASQYVYVKNIKANSQIKVFNIKGQMVYHQVAFDNKTSIDISNFELGSYFIHISNGNKFLERKFMVKR